MREDRERAIACAASDQKGGQGPDLPLPPEQVDGHVGRRLRARREYLGISQARLARHLDLTFSQIQKYEKGQNRIGAGRLYSLSVLLGVPVAYFFEGIGQAEPAQPVLFPKEETERLQRAFGQISDPEARRAVLSLVASLVDEEAGAADRRL